MISLEINSLEDWYKISINQLRSSGGGGLYEHYGSMINLLKAIYPEHKWESNRFKKIPFSSRVVKGYWKDITVQGKLMEEIAKKLSIKENPPIFDHVHGGGFLSTDHPHFLINCLAIDQKVRMIS